MKRVLLTVLLSCFIVGLGFGQKRLSELEQWTVCVIQQGSSFWISDRYLSHKELAYDSRSHDAYYTSRIYDIMNPERPDSIGIIGKWYADGYSVCYLSGFCYSDSGYFISNGLTGSYMPISHGTGESSIRWDARLFDSQQLRQYDRKFSRTETREGTLFDVLIIRQVTLFMMILGTY